MNRQELRQALVKLEQCKVDQVELSQVKGQNTALLERLTGKDNTIRGLENENQNLQGQVRTFKQMESNYEGQTAILNKNVADLNKALKRQKVKTISVGVLAFLAIGGLLFSL